MNTTDAMTDLPWVPVVDLDGTPRDLPLPDVLDRADRLAGVAGEDAPTTAAITRLLLGCWTAAHASGVSPGEWARDWLSGVTLTGERPFLQCPQLAEGASWESAGRALTVLDPFAAGDGPTILDTRHHHCGWAPTPAQVTRLLVARQTFTPGGLHPYPRNTRLGKSVGYASTTAGMLRPLLTIEGATLAETLTASHVPDSGPGPAVSWPGGKTPGQPAHPGGVADALIWPDRALLLDPSMERVMFAAGADDDRDLTVETPAVYPHGLYLTDAKSGVVAPRATRDPWRAVLLLSRAWLDPVRGGLIARLRDTPVDERGEWMLRWRGLAAFQSRMDGVMDVTFPVPTVDDDTVRALVDVVEERRADATRRIYRASGENTTDRARLLGQFTTAAAPRLARIVTGAVTGALDPAAARAATDDVVDGLLGRAATQLSPRRDPAPATRLEPTR